VIVMSTGYRVQSEAERVEAQRRLPKPFEMDELLRLA
jgi:hypothetical protein